MREQSPIVQQAKKALWEQFRSIGGAPVDDDGYVANAGENLLPGIELRDIKEELGGGGGGELASRIRKGRLMKPKFHAVHSSCALAVNAFGLLKRRSAKWDWGTMKMTGLRAPRFEAKLPTGVRRSQANLDVIFDTGTVLLGVESKLTEYLTPKAPHFAQAYVRERLNAEPCWWALIEKYRDATAPRKKHLDEAQLIKHYLGLRRATGPSDEYPGRSVTLLYLFWEPLNASEFSVFAKHQAEIVEFESATLDSEVRFRWMTYQSLWAEWEREDFLSKHVAGLQRRYNVSI